MEYVGICWNTNVSFLLEVSAYFQGQKKWVSGEVFNSHLNWVEPIQSCSIAMPCCVFLPCRVTRRFFSAADSLHAGFLSCVNLIEWLNMIETWLNSAWLYLKYFMKQISPILSMYGTYNYLHALLFFGKMWLDIPVPWDGMGIHKTKQKNTHSHTKKQLVGGFNPFETYARQIGSFPQGVNIKKVKPQPRYWLINIPHITGYFVIQKNKFPKKKTLHQIRFPPATFFRLILLLAKLRVFLGGSLANLPGHGYTFCLQAKHMAQRFAKKQRF